MITPAADEGGTFNGDVMVNGDTGAVLIDKMPTGARGRAAGISAGISRIAAAEAASLGLLGLRRSSEPRNVNLP